MWYQKSFQRKMYFLSEFQVKRLLFQNIRFLEGLHVGGYLVNTKLRLNFLASQHETVKFYRHFNTNS